ncbi:MarR family transcriptional regulator [Rhodoplanes sp. SY1]|uniref:MarR family transcriptional regulator n=1 Tax=Rhodoplanes sp. SY1 TaxID=3166646 RepID=UPI0038B6AE3C
MSTQVNATRNDDNGGLWLTISEIARRRGVDKAGVSRRVSRLVRDGKLSTRPGPRGTKLVNLAAYDHALGETTDFDKVLGAETRRLLAEPEAAGDVAAPLPTADAGEAGRLRTAKADREVYEAELAKLALAEKRKLVLPIAGKHGIEEAMVRVAQKMVAVIDRLPARAGDIAAAATREGEFGVRKLLKELAHQMRETIGREMKLLQAEGRAAEAAGLLETEVFEGELS